MSENTQTWGQLLEPGLRKHFFDAYKERPEQYSKIFNVLSSKKAVETDFRGAGVGLWNEKGSQDSTEYEDFTAGTPNQYIHKTFSKGIKIEKELYDDEMYNVMNKRPKQLARAARATVETHAASVLNNAFTIVGYDGVPLFSNAHTPIKKGVSNITNLATGALTEANLELAKQQGAEIVDEAGLKMQLNFTKLVVPRALEFTAKRILESIQSTTPGGANVFAKNDVNVHKDSLEVIVLDYLDSDTAWFLMDPTANELNFFWREKLNFKGTNDFDTDIAKYKGRMRYSYGYSDFRGWIGSTGV